jgi:hypothetical protein
LRWTLSTQVGSTGPSACPSAFSWHFTRFAVAVTTHFSFFEAHLFSVAGQTHSCGSPGGKHRPGQATSSVPSHVSTG